MSSVRTSPWAAGHQAAYDRLGESIPAVVETSFNEWQERVDRKNYEGPAKGWGYEYLFTVVAQELETYMDGTTQVTQTKASEPPRTYLVTATHGRAASEIVLAYLKQQAPGKTFGLGTQRATIILGGDSK